MNLQPHLDIGHSNNEAAFRRRLVSFAQELGFDLAGVMAGIVIPGRGRVERTIDNVPPGFADASKNLEDGRRDPVLTLLKRSSIPFAYDQQFYVDNGAADLWEQQAAFGYRTGIAVAIHMPRQRRFFVGFDRADPLPLNANEILHSLAVLQLLAVHAQDAAFRIGGLLDEGEEQPRLTARELEVLRWTMDGKSAWAVGRILALSERTINLHAQSACRKLNVSSKHQAVLRALNFGLL